MTQSQPSRRRGVPIPPRRTRLRLAAAAVALCGGMATAATAAPAADAGGWPREGRGVAQQELNALVRENGYVGALAAVRDERGRVRDHSAGVGNLATGERVPADGQVRIASNTKTFTATVVLQLVAEGRVDLDAPVETYLPALVRGEGIDGNRITVRQVLQHTSGLPEFTGLVYTNPADPTDALSTFFEPHELLDLALTQPASFAPGTAWRYSNTNYLLAGLLIQRVTGRPVGEEITRRIIEPLELADTYWPSEGELSIRGEHPRGYAYARNPEDGSVAGPPVDVTDQDTSAPWAAGALVSIPSDLLEFFTALVEGELLPPELLDQMQTTVPVPLDFSVRGVEEGYGLGLQSFALSCGGTAWTHGGDISGTHTRGAVVEDGPGVMLSVTSDPIGLDAAVSLEEAVDAILCR